MDKYEYKLRLEEIKTLNKKGRFQESAQIADTIDWKKVRNTSTLGIISDVYKINRRFDDAREILLLAKKSAEQADCLCVVRSGDQDRPGCGSCGIL